MTTEPQWDEAGMLAVRACIRGEASADQQRRAMQFIGGTLCRRFDSPYIPGATPIDAGVEMGRHLVGVWISNCNDTAYIEAVKAAKAKAIEKQKIVARATKRRGNTDGQGSEAAG